jgi:ribonuclease D
MSVDPDVSMIDSESELLRHVAALSLSSRIGLDAEGDGMFRYRTRLCTLQLSVGERVLIVDTLACDPVRALSELLSARGPEKIVHDVSFDARVLQAHGIVLGNVFDTSIAARFLGITATGLSTLLETRFGLRLDKNHQQADWGKRPLEEDMILYLVEDVRHLGVLAESLLAEVRAKDIEAEVRQEVEYVLASAREREPHEAAWMRIKGVSTLLPAHRAALRAVAEEREAIARQLDVPAGRVAPSDALSRVVARESVDVSTFEKLMPAALREHAGRMHAALLRGQADADAPPHEVRRITPSPLSPASIDARKRRRKILSELRAQESKQRGVDPQVVLPGHCLADMVALDVIETETLAAVPGFGEARLARYGVAWPELLRGKWPR